MPLLRRALIALCVLVGSPQLALSQQQPSSVATHVWPYPADGAGAPWSSDASLTPCDLSPSVDPGRARMTAAECPTDCADRAPYRCAAGGQEIAWWKACDGLNDCPDPSGRVPVGSRCRIALDASTTTQQLLCADDELSCDSTLDRAMDGLVAGLHYNRSTGELFTRPITASVALGSRVRIRLLDTLTAGGTGWNYFRMAIEGASPGRAQNRSIYRFCFCVSNVRGWCVRYVRAPRWRGQLRHLLQRRRPGLAH